jgi:hypothetical protein
MAEKKWHNEDSMIKKIADFAKVILTLTLVLATATNRFSTFAQAQDLTPTQDLSLARELAQAQDLSQFPDTDSNFSTDLTTTYRVNESGQTRVDHTVVITNLKPLFSISQYALQINSANIADVSVNLGKDASLLQNTSQNQLNGSDKIKFRTVANDKFSSIAITFDDQVVGEGKQRVFTISYTDPDVAIISNQILELAIPKIQNREIFKSYTVNIITPVRYGSPNKLNPESPLIELSEAGFLTRFSTETKLMTTSGLGSKSGQATQSHYDGVNVIFGTEQLFDISLQYHLKNSHSSTKLAQIALPPDTQYQRLVYTNLDPQPAEISQDRDGNWIATYQVPASDNITVTANIQAKISLEPNFEVIVPQPMSSHLQPDDFWQSNSKTIRDLSIKHQTPRDIYNFSSENLTYNYDLATQKNSRLGAESVLKNYPDQALCQEFTDVFIALARANNIPARRLTGYAHTNNRTLRPLSFVSDVLHSWPEYFDQELQTWVPVDPTWAHTSGGINYFDQLDLNHIVFAINGESSQRPYPAGSYKISDQQEKDVKVSFGTTFSLPEADLTFDSDFGPANWLPFMKAPQILISNPTGSAQYSQIISFSSSDVSKYANDLNLSFTDASFSSSDADLSSKNSELSIWEINQEIGQSRQIDKLELATILPFETRKKTIAVLDTKRLIPERGTIYLTHHKNDYSKNEQNTTENSTNEGQFNPNQKESGYETVTIETIIFPYYWRWFFNPFVVVGLVVGVVASAIFAGSLLVLKKRSWKPITGQLAKISSVVRWQGQKSKK